IFIITSDNASNNDTFMEPLENICQNKNILLYAVGSYYHYNAHIMNIVVQDILKQIKADEAQTEDLY
ncbi:17773_t:CDS:1, partial [Funneliformis caledonium]